MPDELNPLKNLFGEVDSPSIDINRVIRRSRRRRLPKQIGIGGVSTLAVGGLLVGGGIGLKSLSASSGSSATSAFDTATAPEAAGGVASDGGIKRAPAYKINLCGGALADVAPSESGLVLTPHFPDATAGAASISGTVTMTNTGSTTVTGYTDPTPAITLSQNGIVLWHSNGAMAAMAAVVDLAPGASMTYAAELIPVVCGVEDDETEFRTDLPSVRPGEYQVSAAIDVTGEDDADLITGPTQTITLR